MQGAQTEHLRSLSQPFVAAWHSVQHPAIALTLQGIGQWQGQEAAHRIMMHVHQHGIGECGVYTYEVAETKVTQVMDFARKHQHPLQCVMEKQ